MICKRKLGKGLGKKMITSLSKIKEKRRKKGKKGKEKKENRGKERKEGKGKEKGKRWIFGSRRKIFKTFLWKKNHIFPQWERISYFFLKGKEYHIFSPNSIYQKNMHNLFWGKNVIFFP